MKKTVLITFPKSGKRLLTYILQRYFAESEFFEIKECPLPTPLSIKKIQFCQRTNHCKTTPCTDSKTNLQFFHGINEEEFMTSRDIPKLNYILLYRNPISSLLSWSSYGHDLSVLKFTLSGMERESTKINTLIGWCEYLIEGVALWRKWIYNWILDNKNSNILYLSYENLIENPRDKLKEIIQFIQPKEQVKIELLERVIKSMNIEPKHKTTDFLYYKELSNVLKYLELIVEKEFKELNIEKVMK